MRCGVRRDGPVPREDVGVGQTLMFEQSGRADSRSSCPPGCCTGARTACPCPRNRRTVYNKHLASRVPGSAPTDSLPRSARQAIAVGGLF